MTRRITFPLSKQNGRLVTHEQDSEVDVAQCVLVLIRTRQGVRPLVPEIGFEDPTGEGVDDDDLDPMSDWEPRADLTVSIETSDDGRSQTRTVTVGLAGQSEREIS